MAQIAPPPIREPIIDRNGNISRVWVQWFTDNFNRINERIEQILDVVDGNLPIADADGSLVDSGYDPTTLPHNVHTHESDVQGGKIDHGDALDGLDDTDHNAAYFAETEFLNASAGAADAGKPIKLDAGGQVDATMLTEAGDVDGPAGATTHAIARFDGVTGKLLENSTITINDGGDLLMSSSVTERPIVTIDNLNADDNSSRIEFWKYSASPADSDKLAFIGGYGKNDTDVAGELFAKMVYRSLDISDAHIGGGARISVCVDNVMSNLLDVKGYNGAQGEAEIILNQAGVDCDVRIEALGIANAFVMNGADGVISIDSLTASQVVTTDAAKALTSRAIGIADDNIVEIDDADAADNDYAKFTANGLEGRDYSEVMGDLSGQASADFSMNTNQITNVVDPTLDQDAATKKYVDDTVEYMYPVWAEENSTLAATTYEWAYGNGASTPNDGGITMYVPSGWTCTLVAMSLRLGSGTATVEAVINGAVKGALANVAVAAGQGATNDSFTPVAISNGDYFNFRTTAAAGTSAPNVVTAWFRMVKS